MWCGLGVRQGYACVFSMYMPASSFLTGVFGRFWGFVFGVLYICGTLIVFLPFAASVLVLLALARRE